MSLSDKHIDKIDAAIEELGKVTASVLSALSDQRDALQGRIAAALALHHAATSYPRYSQPILCTCGSHEWPCPTRRALEGEGQ